MYLLFVGSLHHGKQPNQLLQLTAQLRHSGMDAHCYVAGQGPLEAALISQAESLQATDAEHWIHFLGGLDAEQLQSYYQRCHFMVLPSQSEGWPKAVAEAMWWGCVPVVPPISCVSDMLDGGQRGVIMTDLSTTTDALVALWKNPEQYHHMAQSAQQWSQAFTIERFAEGVAAFMQAPH